MARSDNSVSRKMENAFKIKGVDFTFCDIRQSKSDKNQKHGYVKIERFLSHAGVLVEGKFCHE
jgi:hypothetical protein